MADDQEAVPLLGSALLPKTLERLQEAAPRRGGQTWVFLFFETGSLCSSGWSGTHNSPTSAFWDDKRVLPHLVSDFLDNSGF
jgi:hypothetical protein